MGNMLRSLVVGYFLIGAAIGITQLSLSKVFEPPCNGTIVHTLWTGFPKRLDDSEVLAGKSEEPLTFGLARGLVRWLPGLYSELIVGDMSLRDYLLGGYQCRPAVAFPSDFPSQMFDHLLRDFSTLGETDRLVGNRAKALLEKRN